jgi:flagellar basal-body rod modification protein FlgD
MLTNFNPSGANPAAASPKVATNPSVSENRDMFTKLLVAQIRNQDPLAPTDPNQFVNQLSQLSQTEALQHLSQTQSASAAVLQSLQVLAMGAQVGSSVSVATASVRVAGQPLAGTVQLGSASSATTLRLVSPGGQPYTLVLPAHGPGAQAFSIDPAALGLAPGSYAIDAQAADGSAQPVEITGRLDSVRMSASGGVLLRVAGIGEVDPSAITGFNGNGGASQVATLP